MAGKGVGQGTFTHGFAQAALDAVALYGTAHFLGDGEAKAGFGRGRMFGIALYHLQDKAVYNKTLSFCGGGKEIAAVLDGGKRHGLPRVSARRGPGQKLRAEALAALGAAGVDDFAATHGCHAGAEAMAAGANDFAGLIGPFHGSIPDKL